MPVHPMAGKPAPRSLLEDIPRLVAAYYALRPDPSVAEHKVQFGTSGHRGSSLDHAFNEDHILATTQAICDWRDAHGVTGPLFLGADTHALSEPARMTALEVLAANRVLTVIDEADGFTPTPVISHAILRHNRSHPAQRGDGIVITPSHNPPRDGGFKYNPPHGGPAGSDVTGWIEKRANSLLASRLDGVRRIPWERARAAETTHRHDYVRPYVSDLGKAVDLAVVRDAGVRIGVDPLGGSGVGYWAPIADTWGLAIEVVDDTVDPTFGFMAVDKDGRIRMDCSSPYAMARLVGLRERFDIAVGNDPDYDRHGIVTRSVGLMNPNHFLAVAIAWLFTHRPGWDERVGIGKTLVSSSMIDRVAASLHRRLVEVPVGFKWFVEGLGAGTLGFGGEESAGASFLRMDGIAWTTDKDGILMDLLAAEITARSGKDPGEHYRTLVDQHGEPVYERIDAPASPAEKRVLAALSPDAVTADTLAGERIVSRLTAAPGNGAAIGGLKVVTANGWFAARPSGTEDVYKIYAESFLGRDHLARIQQEARQIIADALARGT